MAIKDIPAKGETYFYIRSSMIEEPKFIVVETKWHNYNSDTLRLAQGNVYPNEMAANKVVWDLTRRLEEIRRVCV